MVGRWDLKELKYPTSRASGKAKHHSGGFQVRVQQGGSTESKGTSVKISKYTIYNGPKNAIVCNKTLIQMSHTKTFKITPTCFDHQMIIIRELSDPG
jgi:hypothetical protein